MSTTPYPFGQEVRLGPFVVTDPTTGQPIDPATMVVTVKLPDGTTQTPAVSHDATGTCHVDWLPPASGHYGYHAVSTLPNTAYEGQFDVLPSSVGSDAGQIFGWPGSYLTNAEFRAMPTGVNFDDLIANASAAANDSELANILLRASRWADNYCNIQLGAHQVLAEHETARIGRDGCLRLHPRQTSGHVPPISCTRVAYSAAVGGPATTVTPGALWVEDGAMIIPLSPSGSWMGGFQFGPPSGGTVAVEFDYIAGYPISALTSAATAGVTSLILADTTGIQPGEQLRITDPGVEEQVTVASTWTPAVGPGTVPLAVGTVNAHSAGTGIGTLPFDIKIAVGQIATVYVRKSSDTGTAALDKDLGPDMEAMEAAAAEILERYARVAI